MARCSWAESDTLLQTYHDKEWGEPLFGDRKLFEFLILDGFQAGLSWLTILKKRPAFQAAFDHFSAEKMVTYSPDKIQSLMNNPGIIRNKSKINAAVKNAAAYLNIISSGQSFSDFIWQFTDGKTIVNQFRTWKEIPAETKESQAMSRALKQAGFTFVGPTICYAFMQAAGIVNDHTIDCFRYDEINQTIRNGHHG